MARLRLALATHCLKRPLKPSLTLAARLGAAGVRLDARNELNPADMSATGRRQLLHFLDDLGLKMASLDFPTRGGLCDPNRLDARIEALKEAMSLASQLKTSVVTAKLGGLPPDEATDDVKLLQTVLDDVARHGNHVGVTLAVGLGRDAVSRLEAVLGKVTQGQIGVNFDPATAVGNGFSAPDVLRNLGSLVAHVMVRDAVREPDGTGSEVMVGRGDVPWDEMLASLQELDYRGWLSVDRTGGDDPAGDAGRAIQFLQSVSMG